MNAIPLRVGPLQPDGYRVRRSGVRWLCDDGHYCVPGEAVAFCNITVIPDRPGRRGSNPFDDESRDLQLAFVTPSGGRLRRSSASSQGGALDQLLYRAWDPEFTIGAIEHRPGERLLGEPGDLRLLFVAGRRMTEVAEVRTSLLSGWHSRARAWWDHDGERGTLLSLGLCDLTGVIRGERHAFLELLALAPGAAHAVSVSDEVVVPCARMTLEGLQRTPEAFTELSQDFARTFGRGGSVPTPSDWIFCGALFSALQKSPLADRYHILTRTQVSECGPPDAVLFSINAESPVLWRHRRLGYTLSVHEFRLREVGPAVIEWLRANFEPVKQTIDGVRRDYCDLVDAVSARSSMAFLVVNTLSTLGDERLSSYAQFPRPLAEHVQSVRRKDLNLMLHDLSRERNVTIIDADSIAAELGAAAHVPDNVHQSGPMQTQLREEIVRALRERGVAGFGTAR